MVDTLGSIVPKQALFVGVAELHQFGYRQIREFGHKMLEILAGGAPRTRQLALTIRHPPVLPFDVRGQRCLVYKSIKHLEEILGKELAAIATDSRR